MLENGLVDTWRHQNPDKKSFTYWSYRFNAREKGIGNVFALQLCHFNYALFA